MRLNRATSATAFIVLGMIAVRSASATTWVPALDETVLINNGNAFSPSTLLTFQVPMGPSDRQVNGFSFVGDVFINPAQAPVNASWTQLTIVAPDGSDYVVGGTSGFDASWDFGSQTGSGTYAHGIGGDQWNGNGLPDFAFDAVSIEGTWEFRFLQTFFFGQWAEWQNVSITLHSVPEPSALVVLGAGALLGLQRRRGSRAA